MLEISALRNPIQGYAWGSRRALAEFVGDAAPSPEPQAELWIGAHPSAPSELCVGGRWQPLDACIARDPERALGRRLVTRFGARLPFLMKVLAVEKPLSIQAHPDLETARRGFAREEERGIPIGAPHRVYRDESHKPELVCALRDFRALKGLRSGAEVLALAAELDAPLLDELLEPLRRDEGEAGMRELFSRLLRLSDQDRHRSVLELAEAAEARRGERRAFAWLAEIASVHPGDAGVLAALVLNDVLLEPGDALFLPARQLHCYLSGLAVELMANSDNVLRGGLTEKHVDAEALLSIVDFGPEPADPLAPLERGPGERRFETPAAEFELSELRVGPGVAFESRDGDRGAEILLCVEGSATIAARESADGVALERGGSVFAPACAGPYRVSGLARLYRARVPESGSSPRARRSST